MQLDNTIYLSRDIPNPEKMKGVILHGGSGTRLRPITYTEVKQLLPIAGKPVSEYALENLIEIGITDINIVIGNVGGEEVKEYYGDGSRWNVKISYTYQSEPLGIAHAISLTENFVLEQDFVVILGDNYFQNGINNLYQDFVKLNPDASIALTVVEDPSMFGVATIDNNRITKIVEKPKDSVSNLAVAGVYFLRNGFFEVIKKLKPSWRNELEITEALQLMINRGMDVCYSVINGWWKDTGTPEEFLECNRMILDKIERSIPAGIGTHNLAGRVKIEEGTQIVGESKILGPCFIGSNTVIENSYVGPYSSIGSNCVLKNTEIEDSVVMDNSHIEIADRARMSGSLIGPNVQISPINTKSKTVRLILGRDSKIEM